MVGFRPKFVQGLGNDLIIVFDKVSSKDSNRGSGKGLDKGLGWLWVRSEKGGQKFGQVSGFSVSFNITQCHFADLSKSI